MKTGKTFRAHWESLSTGQRTEFLRSAGVRVVDHRDDLPPIEMGDEPAPIPTDLNELARFEIVIEDGLNAVVYLGNLRDMLARADDL